MAEINRVGYIHYDNEVPASTTRKRIGYISYDNEVIEENVAVATNEKEIEVPMSNAQVSLLDNIGSLVELITGDVFLKFPVGQKDAVVMQLINFVALNAELNTKTMMAIDVKIGDK